MIETVISIVLPLVLIAAVAYWFGPQILLKVRSIFGSEDKDVY